TRTAPSVFPLVPCCSKTGNVPPDTSLACLVTGYLPSPVDIKWNSGQVTKGVKTFPEVTMSNGLHTQSSLLIPSDSSRQGDPYQCDVTHQGTGKTVSGKFPQEWVYLLVPTCEESAIESQLELVCLLLSFSPGKTVMKWLVNGKERSPPYPGLFLCNGHRWLLHGTEPHDCHQAEVGDGGRLHLSSDPPSSGNRALHAQRQQVLGTASRIAWKVDGQVSSVAKIKTLKKNSNGTINPVSSHPVSLAQWGQGTIFTCKVTTLCSGELTQDITMSNTGIREKEPSVTVSQADHKDISRNRVSLTLICEASGFYPEEISMSWLKNNSPELKSSYSGPVSGNGTFSAYSILKVEQSQGEGNYTCMVHHPAMEEPKRVVEKVSLGVSNCNRHPLEVSLLPPSLEKLYIGQNATISCLVSGMETPSSLEVSWNRGSGGPLAVVSREAVLQEDGTYSATSILRVCVEEWQVGEEEFTCTVKHQDIPSAIVKSIRKSHMVSLRAPSVYISPPHAEELVLWESATITCLASGFQPRDILVTRTQQERPVPQEAYTNIGPVREAGKEEHYFIYSKLNVLASEWERGNTYACVVGHEGLPMTFVQESVDKASGKPTFVNVSVILSDTDVTCY
ncbi:unnamed protein product, partial [Caretta caretta]